MSDPNSSKTCANLSQSALKRVSGRNHPSTKVGCDQDDRTQSRLSNSSKEQNELFFQRKYVIDRWVGASLLLLTSPLTLLLYVVVRSTSRGPGFYRQKRVGLDGSVFEIIKLRSMVQDAETPGKPVWSTKGDARVTRIGRVLRKLHLDELPQLWNVARGEMSLVGPRPERPEICEKLAGQINGYYDRVVVKPGVTGLSQINLPPDETLDDVQRKQVLDLHYIENANFWLELRILAATGMRMIGIKGATVMRVMRLCRRHLLDVSEPTEAKGESHEEASYAAEQQPAFAYSSPSDSAIMQRS